MKNKRLYRSRADARIAGVCAGLGDYLEVDPVFVRVVWAVGTCVTGIVPGILAYLVAWFVMPEQPDRTVVTPSPARGSENGA